MITYILYIYIYICTHLGYSLWRPNMKMNFLHVWTYYTYTYIYIYISFFQGESRGAATSGAVTTSMFGWPSYLDGPTGLLPNTALTRVRHCIQLRRASGLCLHQLCSLCACYDDVIRLSTRGRRGLALKFTGAPCLQWVWLLVT